ncbi:MAG: CvpA family protein [Candidatus Cloacimonetes bacterium]|nr:CvpA family protein [Candidatus Cloacimonadota bacterium]
MNFLDIILMIFLLIFFVIGLKRGFILSFLQLLGIILVIVLVRQFGVIIREDIHVRLGISETWAIILGYVVIFIIVMILAKLISLILEKLMALISMGWLNNFIGGIFSVLFGFAIIIILVLLIEISSISTSLGKVREESKIYSAARVIAENIINNYVSEIPGSRQAPQRPPIPRDARPL